MPDLTTFGKLCQWLKINPADLLGISSSIEPSERATGTAVAHFGAPNERSIRKRRARLQTSSSEPKKCWPTCPRNNVERGFKSRCENIAKGLRKELGLNYIDPLPPQQLAAYLDVPVLALASIPGLEPTDIRQLLEIDPGSWSAITVSAEGREAIITNTAHRGGRPSTDIMHELAHLLLGHEPSTMYFVGEEDIALRGHNKDTEDEANWMAGTLLLPRDALVYIQNVGMVDTEVCKSYDVSMVMLRYRMDITGVSRQFGRRAWFALQSAFQLECLDFLPTD